MKKMLQKKKSMKTVNIDAGFQLMANGIQIKYFCNLHHIQNIEIKKWHKLIHWGFETSAA